MLTDHPAATDLETFINNASASPRNPAVTRIVRHLLAGCPICQEQLLRLGWSPRRLERLVRLPVGQRDWKAASLSNAYDAAFAKAENALGAFYAEDRPAEDDPVDLLAALASLPEQDQVLQVVIDARFASPGFVRKLVDLSYAARYENVSRMLQLALLARLAAEACTSITAGSPAKLADLRALSWRQYANALRISGRMREAEEAFAQAQNFCDAGTGDPPLRANLFARLLSLRVFQRRFDEAIALADEAASIYSELGEDHSVASTMVQKAIAQIYSGEADAAVRTLNRAIPLVDPEGDPHLLLAACHNLVRAYIETGEPERALSIFFEVRSLFHDYRDPLIALRASWQEGQILRDLGHLRAAEAALLKARQGFLERGLLYEVAVVSLDLASVYLRLGETANLRETVAAMVPIFSSLGVDRDALAALLQLQQAEHQDEAAFELIRFLSSRLEQLPQRE